MTSLFLLLLGLVGLWQGTLWAVRGAVEISERFGISQGFVGLAILAVVFSVIGAFYYLRVVKLMYFDEPDTDARLAAPVDFTAAISLNGALMLGLGLFSGSLIALCMGSFMV